MGKKATNKKLKGLQDEVESLTERVAALEARGAPKPKTPPRPAAVDPVAAAAERVRASAGTKPAGTKRAGTKPSGTKPAGTKPAGTKRAGTRAKRPTRSRPKPGAPAPAASKGRS